MVIINKYFIESLIQEVAPKVKKLTGWDAHLCSLNVKIISPDEFWDYEKNILEICGINLTPKTIEGRNLLEMQRKESSYIIGEYQALTNTMLISNCIIRKSLDVQACIIGHELMHRCQHVNNRNFTEDFTELVMSAGPDCFDRDVFEDEGFAQRYFGHKDLTEGDAMHVENQLIWEFYLLAEGRYTLGDKRINILEKIHKKEGRAGVNKIYNLSLTEIYKLFNP